jgi:hypothetical protein
VHRGRFVLACAVAAIVILWAPYVSQIRRAIRAAFPGHFVLVVGSIVGVLIGGALLAALARIRERRGLRYGLLAAAVVLGVGYSLATRDGRPDVDVVERFHFVEFGLVTLLFYRAWRPLGDLSMLVLPVLAGLLVGTLEEWFQWFVPVRVGEMRDIFLNIAAIATGLLFSVAVDPPASLSRSVGPGSFSRIGRFAAVVMIALAGFFQCVHLGYAIHDAEIGTFRSRYTAARLLELAADRAREWAAHPPPLETPKLAREDQYLTEGIEHVAERNELWGAGNIAGAWFENRILEQYYAPVIVTPSYHAKVPQRWPDEQRRDAEAGVVSGFSRTYVSESNPAPLYTWSKTVFWICVLALVAIEVAAFEWMDRAQRQRLAAAVA